MQNSFNYVQFLTVLGLEFAFHLSGSCSSGATIVAYPRSGSIKPAIVNMFFVDCQFETANSGSVGLFQPF